MDWGRRRKPPPRVTCTRLMTSRPEGDASGAHGVARAAPCAWGGGRSEIRHDRDPRDATMLVTSPTGLPEPACVSTWSCPRPDPRSLSTCAYDKTRQTVRA